MLAPLAIYMVPCRVEAHEWSDVMREHTGVILDRCRITTFGTRLSTEVAARCATWIDAALERENIQIAADKMIAINAVAGSPE